MRTWQVSDRDLRCGYDYCKIGAGEPYQVITGTGPARVRCQAHAQGPVDWDAIRSSSRRDPEPSSWQPVRSVGRTIGRALFDAKAKAAGE